MKKTLDNTYLSGNSELIMYLVNLGIETDKGALDNISKSGSSRLVKYLICLEIEIDKNTLYEAKK